MAPSLEIKNSVESAGDVGQGYQLVTGHQESVDCEVERGDQASSSGGSSAQGREAAVSTLATAG